MAQSVDGARESELQTAGPKYYVCVRGCVCFYDLWCLVPQSHCGDSSYL